MYYKLLFVIQIAARYRALEAEILYMLGYVNIPLTYRVNAHNSSYAKQETENHEREWVLMIS